MQPLAVAALSDIGKPVPLGLSGLSDRGKGKPPKGLERNESEISVAFEAAMTPISTQGKVKFKAERTKFERSENLGRTLLELTLEP